MSKSNPEIIAARIHSESARLMCTIAAMQADNAGCAFEGRPPMHGSYNFEHERIGHDLLVKDILAELEAPPSESAVTISREDAHELTRTDDYDARRRIDARGRVRAALEAK